MSEYSQCLYLRIQLTVRERTSSIYEGERRFFMSKVWLITGSGNGLGRDIAEVALAAGDSVVAGARRTEELAPLVAQYHAQGIPGDHTCAWVIRASIFLFLSGCIHDAMSSSGIRC